MRGERERGKREKEKGGDLKREKFLLRKFSE